MLSIETITPGTLSLFKTVRLQALQDTPLAFGSTYAREAAFSDEDWRARLERWNGDTGIGFLAIDRGVPCGIAGSLIDPADSTRADLISMWLAPAHRRRGLGKMLVQAVVDWARLRKIFVLRLMVTHTNQSAIEFYLTLGFAMTGRTEPYPNDLALTELELTLSIG